MSGTGLTIERLQYLQKDNNTLSGNYPVYFCFEIAFGIATVRFNYRFALFSARVSYPKQG